MNQNNNKKLALVLATAMAGSVLTAPLNAVYAHNVPTEGISERLEDSRERILNSVDKSLSTTSIENSSEIREYDAPVQIKKHNTQDDSMANKAVEKTAHITEENGKTKVTMVFKPMKIQELEGHLIKMSVNGKDVKVVEQENKKPKKVVFEVEGHPERITASVEVDVMNELADGKSAPQDVDIIIDWQEKTEEKDKEQLKNEESENKNNEKKLEESDSEKNKKSDSEENSDSLTEEGTVGASDSEEDEVQEEDKAILDYDTYSDKDLTLADKLEDGIYTISFRSYERGNKNKPSMIEDFFDENVKLTVEGGKYKIETLCKVMGSLILDFTLKDSEDKEYPKAELKDFGDIGIDGKPTQKLITIPVENIDKTQLGAVLVSGPMQGRPEDKGHYERNIYKKVDIVFNNEVKKGFEGFKDEQEKKIAEENSINILINKLNQSGFNISGPDDKDLIKKLQETDVKKIDLRGSAGTGYINDISLLKYLGSSVEELDLDNNHISKIDKDVFKNMVNLKKLNLNGLRTDSLPEEIFSNNSKLEDLSLGLTQIKTLPDKIFENNTNLKELGLAQNKLESLPKHIFDNNKELTGIYLYQNNLKNLDDDIFKNNKKLKGIYLRENKLESLPESINNMPELKQIDASNNKISFISKKVNGFAKLKRLELNNNHLRSIPDDLIIDIVKNIDNINDIVKIDLKNNLIEYLPVEKIKINMQNIKNKDKFYFETENNKLNINSEDANNIGIRKNFPQLNVLVKNFTAENGIIKLEEDINILEYYFASLGDSFNNKAFFKDKEDLLSYLQEKAVKENIKTAGIREEDIKKIFENKLTYWQIKTVVKKNGREIYNKLEKENPKDSFILEIKDPYMKKGDFYEIEKTLYTVNTDSEVKSVIHFEEKTMAESDGDLKTEDSAEKTLNVKALNPSTKDESMANSALYKKVFVEKTDGKYILKFYFKTLEYSGLEGNLIKLKVNGKDASKINPLNDKYKIGYEISLDKIPERINAEVEIDVMNEIAHRSNPQQVEFVFENTEDGSSGNTDDNSSANEKDSINNSQDKTEDAKSLKFMLEICRNIAPKGFNKDYYSKLQEAISYADSAVKLNKDTDVAFYKLLDAYNGLNNLGRIELGKSEVPEMATEVPVKIRHYSQNTDSMANNAVYKNVFIEEKNGKYIARIYFKPLKIRGLKGNIISFRPENKKATKIEGLNSTYSTGYEFILDEKSSEITAVFEADVMNELSGGKSAPQKAILDLNWKLAHITKGEIAESAEDNKIDRKGLKDLIDEAESLVRNNYTKDSLKDMDRELDSAKEVYESKKASEDDVNKAQRRLDRAIRDLVRIKNEIKAENGEIAVPVRIKNASMKGRDSMADKAVNSKIYVTEDNDRKEATYRIYFKAMKLRGMEGNIKNLFIYDGSRKERATRIDGKGEYAQGFEFIRNKLREDEIKIAVDVDIMNELGAGAQDAVLVLDWKGMETVKDDDKKDVKSEPLAREIINRSPKTASYVRGYSDGSFRPNEKITRAEVASMISKLIDKKHGNSFSLRDVDKNAWYADDVSKLVSFGIIKGYEDGSFRPDREMTRAEVAVMIAKSLNLNSASAGFRDTGSHWAKSYIGALKENNIINGYSDGSFKPDEKVTRAEMVAMINRAFNIVADSNKESEIKSNRTAFNDVMPGEWFYRDIMTAK